MNETLNNRHPGWLSLDWLIRTRLAAWLECADLPELANQVRELDPIFTLQAVIAAWPVIDEVCDVLSDTGEAAWFKLWDVTGNYGVAHEASSVADAYLRSNEDAGGRPGDIAWRTLRYDDVEDALRCVDSAAKNAAALAIYNALLADPLPASLDAEGVARHVEQVALARVEPVAARLRQSEAELEKISPWEDLQSP